MGYLVRKFTRNKWGNPIATTKENITADAITSGCLRTGRNEFSVWRIADESEIANAILALIGTLERIQGFHYISLPEDDILSLGLEIRDTPGRTFVTQLQHKHADIVNLTYETIGLVANEIRKGIVLEKYSQITESAIKRLLRDEIEAGRVNKNDIPKKILDGLGFAETN